MIRFIYKNFHSSKYDVSITKFIFVREIIVCKSSDEQALLRLNYDIVPQFFIKMCYDYYEKSSDYIRDYNIDSSTDNEFNICVEKLLILATFL